MLCRIVLPDNTDLPFDFSNRDEERRKPSLPPVSSVLNPWNGWGGGHRLIHPSPKICFHPFIYIAYAIIPIYPRLKKNGHLLRSLVIPIISFVRSIKRRRNFQFPNTNKDPTFLRWIPSIFSFKNSHNIVKKIKRIIINYIIRGKIEKPFNLIDDSKDVFERARLMLIRDELESWRDSISNICCLEDRSKLISLFVNDYFVISLPFPCRFILARLEYVFFA